MDRKGGKENVEVSRRMNIRKSSMEYAKIEKEIMDRTRNKRNSLWIVTIIEGKIGGKPGRVRPRTPFLKQFMEDTGIGTRWE